MNAAPLLARVARALNHQRLEAVMLGNAAAALHGAPVTTVDIDFLFRKTRTNVAKLKAVAQELDATIFRPFYPPTDMYRLENDDAGIQLDFLTRAHGVRSLSSLRSRAVEVSFLNHSLLVAALEDIIASKRSTDRAKDKAVLPLLEETLRVKNQP